MTSPADETAEAEGSPSPEAPIFRTRPGDPAAFAVQAALSGGLHWLRVNDPAAREGSVEGVHRLRTTTRRLRSTLQVYEDLIDSSWTERLGTELKWLTGLLGNVRDLDVLRDRLSESSRGLHASEALAPLFAELDQRHAAASEALRASLRGDRYRGLVDLLADAAATLPVTDAARKPCGKVLPRLVRKSWEHLKRGARAVEEDSPDDDFHDVRKRAKRARHAAESIRDALGADASKAADRFARHVKKLQDVLGVHQDAVVAIAEIRHAASARPQLGAFNFAAGRLLEDQSRLADESRAKFFRIWPDPS